MVVIDYGNIRAYGTIHVIRGHKEILFLVLAFQFMSQRRHEWCLSLLNLILNYIFGLDISTYIFFMLKQYIFVCE